MVDAWLRVVQWLHENAAATWSVLAPPGAAVVAPRWATLQPWFEVQGGVDRDPRGGVLFGYWPLSAAEAEDWAGTISSNIATWGEWAVEEFGDGDALVPIAEGGSSTLLVVDLRTGIDAGAVKELDWEDPSTLRVARWAGVEDMLDDLVRCLETLLASRALPVRPVVTGGLLTWVAHLPAPPPPAGPVTAEGEPPFWTAVVRRAARTWLTSGSAAAASGLGPELDQLLALDPAELRRAADADPDAVGTIDVDVLLAACVHEAYRRAALPAPGWCTERWRFLRPAWVLTDFPSAVLRSEHATPAAFSEHGIALEWTGAPGTRSPS